MGRFKQLFFERASDARNLKFANNLYEVLTDEIEDSNILQYDKETNSVYFSLDVEPEIVVSYELSITDDNSNVGATIEKNDDGSFNINFSPESNKYHHTLRMMGPNHPKFEQYFGKNIQHLIPKTLFIHEIAHYLDKGMDKHSETAEYGKFGEEYYNDFTEIQAYLMQYFNEYVEYVKNGSYEDFDEFFKEITNEMGEAWGSLSEDNKKRVRKRIYSFWSNNNENR